ncbi:MAG: hypothetical protein EOO29_05600 [Comamonadaceae bacterium]|nr:MAG: hypothetical protein EOO29_05600 [Comamonadaceae bacterium]
MAASHFIARRPTPAHRQSGAALIFTLVALIILLAGGVAAVRSMNSNLNNAGNLAFRRDLINQGEEAVAKALAAVFPQGAAAAGTAMTAVNYSPIPLPANAQGIPLALLSDTEFVKNGRAANDLAGRTNDVKIRYIIERLCTLAAETASAQGLQNCVAFSRDSGGGSDHLRDGAKPPVEPVYRVSARVTGPRNTQVFIQSAITRPEPL